MSSFQRISAAVAVVVLAGVTPLALPAAASAAEHAPVIAYLADADGDFNTGVYMRNADGTGTPTVLVPEWDEDSEDDSSHAYDLAVSPDGTQIVYVVYSRTPGASRTELVIQELRAGATPRTLVEVLGNSSGEDYEDTGFSSPSFSADGTSIVYARQTTYQSSSGPLELYRVPAAGGTSTFIPTGDEYLFEARQTPGGNIIGYRFEQLGQDAGQFAMSVVPAGGGTPVTVAGPETPYDVTFSPDGTTIVWVEEVHDGQVVTSVVQAATWNEDGATVSLGPIRTIAQQSGGWFYTPTFTADGEHLVATLQPDNRPESDLVRMSAAGGEVTTVVATAEQEWESAVGRALAAATVPAAPAAPTATPGDGAASVSWTAPASGGSPITGYTVTSSPGGRTCSTSGSLSCTVTGLTNGTGYTFTVKATNAVGSSAASPSSSSVTPTAAPPPEPDAVERYVTKVYNDLFDRDPDPEGLDNWADKLRSGTPYGEVANGITYSREFRTGLITHSYDHYLGRSPDPQGLENWLNAMATGLHIEQMEAGFIASAEFYEQAGADDRQWISALYAAVLQRDAGQSEIEFWQDQLDKTGDYNGVARGFLYSTEHLTSVVDGYYQHLLGRGIDPAGRDTWVTAIQRGARDEQIIASIVSSAEYRSHV